MRRRCSRRGPAPHTHFPGTLDGPVADCVRLQASPNLTFISKSPKDGASEQPLQVMAR